MYYVYLLVIFLLPSSAIFWKRTEEDDNKNNEGGLCFTDLGCFPITSHFFDPILRPFNLNPQNPEDINTTFWLYTRKNMDESILISHFNKQSIDESNFDGTKPIIFITHGFTDNHESGWMKEMVAALLEIKEANVIAVDWSLGATFPYTLAVANTRVVGNKIGNFALFFKDHYNTNLDDIHIIGHSLGAQIAGYAGQWLNGTIGRISGLDPAAFFYQGMPKRVILDRSDGQFVDIIHTDSHPLPYIGLGIPEAHGHFDFYPDGGRNIKSCNFLNGIKKIFQEGLGGIRSILSCSHSMAVALYTKSINGNCPFTAYTCDSIESYKDGKCMNCAKPGRDCAEMGYHAVEYFNGENNHKNFYLTTSEDDSKLCVYHWVMEIESSPKSRINRTIDLHVEVKAENGHMDETIYKSVLLKPDETYHHLLEYPDHPGKILSLVFSWDSNGSNEKLYIKKITLTPIDIIDQSERRRQTLQFCGRELQEGVQKSSKITLTSSTEC